MLIGQLCASPKRPPAAFRGFFPALTRAIGQVFGVANGVNNCLSHLIILPAVTNFAQCFETAAENMFKLGTKDIW